MDIVGRVLDPTVACPPHCCVCLNGHQGRVPATRLVKGYAVCEEHVEEIRQQDFDITKLGKRSQSL
jgi:hypothetical protein